jgi:hypothetical protein
MDNVQEVNNCIYYGCFETKFTEEYVELRNVK